MLVNIGRRRKISVSTLSLLVILSALLSVPSLYAQDATAKILGTVSDPTGAIVPDAVVTATNTGTNISTNGKSDSNGNFQINQLPIGNYKVSATKEGFAVATSAIYKLEINASQRIDFKLAVAGTTQTVDVSVHAAAVDTVSSTVGGSVTERPLVDLPLNGRNILDLAQLQPGVTNGQNPGNTSAGCSSGPAGCVSISGGRTDSVTYLLDGGNNTSLIDNSVVFNPNPDAVEEFRILENSYAAEYGRNGGGVISVVSKEGAHDLHGSLFEFNRNKAYNANYYFNKRTDPVSPVPDYKRNQFGGTIGGELFIPHFVPRTNRAFFFFSYEGQRSTQAAPPNGGASQVATPLEAQGNFSQSDSDTIAAVADFLKRNPYFQANPALAAQGIIDPSKIDPVAAKYMAAKLFVIDPSGSVNPNGATIDNFDQFNGRFDVVVTQRDRLTVTLARNHQPRTFPFSGGVAVPTPTLRGIDSYVANIADIHTFTPNVLNEFRLVAQRLVTTRGVPVGKLPSPSDLGVNIKQDLVTGPTVLDFANVATLFGTDPNGPVHAINNTFDFSDNVSWVKGRHNLKFGFDFAPYQNNETYDYYGNGQFAFNGLPNPDTGNVGGSSGFAEFLLGTPDNYFQSPNAPSNIRAKSTYAFAQDEFHVTRRLTLNYGLRYEFTTPKSDTFGRTFTVNPALQSNVFVNAPKGLLFPGDKGAPRGVNFPDKNDFAPRAGFAYDVAGTGKTVVRGGFGVFYDILKGEDNLQFNGQAPFFAVANINSCGAGGTACFTPAQNKPTGYLADPYGSTGTTNPFPSKTPSKNLDFAAAGLLPVGGTSVYLVDPHLRTPYTFQYNLGIQQEIGRGVVAEVAYVASLNRKYTALVDQNPQQPDGSHLFQDKTGIPDNGTNPLNFLQLQTFVNAAYGNYNSLQAQLRKNTAKLPYVGTTYLQLSYTYAKELDNNSGFRQLISFVPFYNHDFFYARGDSDVRHRIVLSGGWDLPFDDLFARAPKFISKGWSLYPIASYQTGFPLDVLSSNFQNFGDGGPTGLGDQQLGRANLVGSHVVKLNTYGKSSNGNIYAPFFDPNSFSNTADNTQLPGTLGYGTLPRNSFSGPNRTNIDLSLAKVTKLFGGERGVSLELRGDFFNAFNITQFKDPNLNLGGGQFGDITTTYDPRIIQLAGKLRF